MWGIRGKNPPTFSNTKALAMPGVGSQYPAKLLSIDHLSAINIHPLEEITQVIWARLLASPLGCR